MRGSREDTEIVQISAPLTNDPNSSDQNGVTPIHLAALNGFEKILRILAPSTKNPNAPDNDGGTPIQIATEVGHDGIVQILRSFQCDKSEVLSDFKKY